MMGSYKRVIVTGHQGYIGPHLIQLLKSAGYYTTGIDLGLFEGCEWYPSVKPDEEKRLDIRQLTVKDFEGFDAVIHLAAISNDPMGELASELTKNVNLYGSMHLAQRAKEAGVKKFLFSSSCSIYGKGRDESLNENADLMPLSVYAESKILTEKFLSSLASPNFCPVFLRNSTAFGHSPMFRVDLVVNNLLACAYTKGSIQIQSDGTPWRPLMHCYDIARAFMLFLDAPDNLVKNIPFNIGSNNGNYQVKDVADLIQQELPNAKIVYTGEVGKDPRNYKVDFSRLEKIFPHFKLEYDLQKGIHEMHKLMKKFSFSLTDFDGDKFVRLRRFKKILAENNALFL